VVERTGGVPLFVEGLTLAVVDSGEPSSRGARSHTTIRFASKFGRLLKHGRYLAEGGHYVYKPS
jgi:hypothetical protein